MELKQKTKRFSRQLIKLAITDVESGLTRTEVCQKYGMCYDTLGNWLKRYGDKDFEYSVRTKITNHQKRLIINSIEQGTMSIAQANLAYKISGSDTVRKWLRNSKNSNADIDSNESIMPTLNNPVAQNLQRALHQANLKVLALETLIDVAEEQLNIKIRKKPGAKQ